MCFSATASFTVASLLTGVGLVTTYHAKGKRSFLHATVPLLFAVQQASEGFVWLTMGKDDSLHYLFAYIFVIFAFIVWPIMIPVSFLQMESSPPRRRILQFLTLDGVVLAAVAGVMMVLHPLNIGMEDHHLMYYSDIKSDVMKNVHLFFYALATVLPFFIIISKKSRLFGLALLATLLITYGVSFHTFISVWCYFAAIISAMTLLIVYERPKRL